MLLSYHLVLFEFKLPLSYEKLVGLVFELLVQVIDLGSFTLESSEYVLRLDNWSTSSRLVGGMLV